MSAARSRSAAVAVASAIAAGAVELSGVHSPVRVVVVLWFLLAAPGMAIVGLLGLADAVAEVALAPALSITLATAVAAIGVYSGLWAPGATLAVLIAITIGAGAATLRRARESAARP
jgi:hypothetical protein